MSDGKGKTMKEKKDNVLDAGRKEIEEIDRAMAHLFHRRMEVSRTIGRYKKDRGLPIRDRHREEALLANNEKKVPEKDREAYRAFFQEVLALSRTCQEEIQEGAWTEKKA